MHFIYIHIYERVPPKWAWLAHYLGFANISLESAGDVTLPYWPASVEVSSLQWLVVHSVSNDIAILFICVTCMNVQIFLFINMSKKNIQSLTTGKWARLPHWPMVTHHHFETLALGSCTYYAARRSSTGESGVVQVTVAVFFQRPDIVLKST
jgi:hypothetical protein